MLIWIRANKDELIYTFVMAIALVGILVMIFGDYRIGFTIGLGAIFLLLMGIVWNE